MEPTPAKEPSVNTDRERPFVITGGAGFIGAHLAHRLLSRGAHVVVFDNLSHSGANENIRWLESLGQGSLRVETGDVRDQVALARALQDCAGVFHLAAQVSIKRSLEDPLLDLEINIGGTINVLEALRLRAERPFLVYASTSQVYGSLSDLPISEAGGRYQPMDQPTRARGIGEGRRLDFTSPLACSKGAADQYVLDYARNFGLHATAFRLGCVIGPRQQGNEEQNLVAHYFSQTLNGRPVTIPGDGKQVRDLLYIDDAVDALMQAVTDMTRLRGRVFNLGGGPQNTVSLLEVVATIEELHGRRPELRFAAMRPGAPRYYAADTRALRLATGWEPRVSAQTGMARLYRSLVENPPAKPHDLSSAAASSFKRAAP